MQMPVPGATGAVVSRLWLTGTAVHPGRAGRPCTVLAIYVQGKKETEMGHVQRKATR